MPSIDQQVMQQILKTVATVRDGSKQLMGKMTLLVRMVKKHDSKIERLEQRISSLEKDASKIYIRLTEIEKKEKQ